MNRDDRRNFFMQGMAVLLLLMISFASAFILGYAMGESRISYVVVTVAMDLSILIGFLARSSLCTIFSGITTCVWVSYKLYLYYMTGALILPLDYLFIPLPLLGALSAALFNRSLRMINAENDMLRRQVEELVLIDEVTGMYNLRALYKDLPMMVKYSNRNGIDLSLMILQIRYDQELSHMLSPHNYLDLHRRVAQFVMDTVRLEDRVYCLDDNGMLGVLLTTNDQGADIVRGRIMSKLDSTDRFEGILSRDVKLSMRIACKQYTADFGDDMLRFKKAVESELVYDV